MNKNDFSKSFLNNSLIRWINGIAILLTIICILGTHLYLKSVVLIPSIFLSIIFFGINYHAIMKKVDFFEWDYTERQKKARFIEEYLFLNGLFSILSVFSLSFCFVSIYYLHNWTMMGFCLIPALLFLFNALYTVKIWFPFFEDDLLLAYKIQKKPQNWIDKGREIRPEDEIDEIMHRDFGI